MAAKPVKIANLFALLDDQESDDITKIVEGLHKPEAPSSMPKRNEKKEENPKHKGQFYRQDMRAKRIYYNNQGYRGGGGGGGGRGRGKYYYNNNDYQDSLLENRKPLEALKKGGADQVRRVEEFGSMQLIGKKKLQDKKKEFEEKKLEEADDKKEFEEIRKKQHANSSIKTITMDWTNGSRRRYHQQRRNFGRQEGHGDDGGAAATNNNDIKPAQKEKAAKEYRGRFEDHKQFPSLGTA
ncbi:hypothetical protein CCACVL1_27893 [Corchorus capsularis]|uniref:Uncharacterized protein n=1 Tax=Corchorus capsularis TaxID=210143 RepID=A0A1R3G8E2_COCAP|nr:hypothetical protein CCACVL1_27893 [Corchorus capsularis]